jgi:hypothetical protein
MFALVIDDDVRVRQALSEELRRRIGYAEVESAGAGPELIQQLHHRRPEVLFFDLALCSRFEMLALGVVPPAIVPLSSSDHPAIRELQSVGLSAWMKPEVFSELDGILARATTTQHDTARLWREWALVARQIGSGEASRLAAFHRDQPILIELHEVLAGRTSNGVTELALASRIVHTPYPLDLISKQVSRELSDGRAMISRRSPIRGLLALARLCLKGLPFPRISARSMIGATIVDNRDCACGLQHARRNRK